MSYYFAGLSYSPNDLTHHGVEGQKWGVRHGPPYPIDDKTLKAGSRLNSINAISMKDEHKFLNRDRWRYTYNPDDKWDSKVYKGPFAIYKLQSNGMKPLFEHQYEVNRDLKMPNKKERLDAFMKVYEENKRSTINDLTKVRRQLQAYQAKISDLAAKVDFKKLKTSEDIIAAYEIFNHAMEANHAFKSTRKYSELMSRKYDAMVDDNNQGIYNRVHDPIIVFKAHEVLTEIGDIKLISIQEIKSNYAYIQKELNKRGEPVKL